MWQAPFTVSQSQFKNRLALKTLRMDVFTADCIKTIIPLCNLGEQTIFEICNRHWSVQQKFEGKSLDTKRFKVLYG